MNNAHTQPTCRICGKPLPVDHPSSLGPFCSDRCRMNDLSKWFGESYKIASTRVDDEDDATARPSGSTDDEQ